MVTKKLFCVLALLILFSSITLARTKVSRSSITTKLPPIDTVFIFKFNMKNGMDYSIESTAASVILKGNDAQQLASLWRSQSWFESAAACHFPGYGIQFLSNGKVITFATVCLMCKNVSFEKPLIRRWQAFDWESKKGKKLMRFFPKIFGDKYKEEQ